MLKILAALLLFCSVPGAALSQTVTVLQWNTFHGGRGTDDRADPSRQVSWIAAKHPDVVTLNEVTSAQAEEYRQRLESMTGETWYSQFVQAQADGIGNQILSRHPLLTTSGYTIRTRGDFGRAVTAATIDVGGTPVAIFATHLDNSSAQVRSAQATEVARFIARFPAPRIVAGDMNARPTSPELAPLTAVLTDTWTEALQRGRATSYTDNPPGPDTRTRRRRIDYILHSAGLTTVQADIPDQRDLSNNATAVHTGTADDAAVRPSDHNFVFAVLSLGNARQ